MTTPPPAGWYANPHGPGLKYWNGMAWTEHVAAPPPPPTTFWGQQATPSPGGPWPVPPANVVLSAQAGTSEANLLSIIGIICGVVAFLFFPILFGPAGLTLGGIAISKREPLGWVALGVSAAGLVIGMILGVLAWGY